MDIDGVHCASVMAVSKTQQAMANRRRMKYPKSFHYSKFFPIMVQLWYAFLSKLTGTLCKKSIGDIANDL